MKSYNGVNFFAKKNFKADLKRSRLYIILTAITMAIIFNLINISYNNIYTTTKQYYTKGITNDFSRLTTYSYPITLIQKQNLLIVVLITMLFAAICNANYIKRRAKEIGFVILNGGSLIDVMKYLMYMTGRCYFISLIIGTLIAIVLMPIISYIMNFSNGKEISLFSLNLEALGISLIYIVMQYILLIILNISFVVKREVIELLNIERTIDISDNRQVKIPSIIFVLLYLIPIILAVLSQDFEGLENLTNVIILVGILGIFGVIRFFIPKFIDKLKKKNFMHKGVRRIYYCNFIYSLSNSIIYILAFISSISYFIYNVVKFKRYDGMTEMNMFSIFLCSFIITSSLLYKLLVDTDEKMYIYWQLKRIGYNKSHILDIVVKDSILFFLISMMLPIVLIISSLVSYVKSGIYDFNLAVYSLVIVLIPIIIISIIAVVLNGKKVKESL